MNEKKEERLTCKCPRGHKLRGGSDLVGRSVRCPRCSEKFVFGYHVREDVTDTAVVRILGDAPSPPPMPQPEFATRPCQRCGVGISAKSTVCEHCNCYVGSLPDFLANLGSSRRSSIN